MLSPSQSFRIPRAARRIGLDFQGSRITLGGIKDLKNRLPHDDLGSDFSPGFALAAVTLSFMLNSLGELSYVNLIYGEILLITILTFCQFHINSITRETATFGE
jgi:hypothetical protein